MKSKSDRFVCVVPKGGQRKGCGGGAKVEELDKAIKRIAKRVAHLERPKAKKRKSS